MSFFFPQRESIYNPVGESEEGCAKGGGGKVDVEKGGGVLVANLV